jgi:hypothetical protein
LLALPTEGLLQGRVNRFPTDPQHAVPMVGQEPPRRGGKLVGIRHSRQVVRGV